MRLLIVEDDLALRTGLQDTFVAEGYSVTIASDGDEARDLLMHRNFDLVVLDCMLPGRSGLELLKELRERGDQTQVLMLTARGDEMDRVLGFELGADDYVTKPFSQRELIARVKARLKSVRSAVESTGPSSLQLGSALIDLEGYSITRPGVDGPETKHALSPREAGMLRLLLSERGKAVRRERFLDEVWGTEQFVGPRTIDTHMLNLRQKIEDDPRQPRFLETVHGIGYRLTSP